MEDIQYGQRVRVYKIEGLTNGAWTKLISGVSIGYKKIDVLDTVQVEGIRLHVTETVDIPVIQSFAAYNALAQDSAPVEHDRPSNLWQKVAGWNSTKLTTHWQTLDIDLTPCILAPGQYKVEFRKTGGSGTLEVQSALAIMAGTESPHLITPLNQPHAWNINRTAQVTTGPQGRTALRVKARVTGESPWKGDLVIRRAK
ncbi:MAG: hypothetical protein GY809_29790 [Planctomycetes bacterium]|nr:hypothetical protein [Planctomycetota bacterium]